MEILDVKKNTLEVCVKKAADVLRAGGVILYPTDTLYGLGADAFSDEGIRKVCDVKDRDERRPIHAVFADMDAVAEYAVISDVGRRLAETFLPGPLTLIFDKKPHIETGIGRDLASIGIRIPANEFCIALAKEFGRPFTTTSANKSGRESLLDLNEIIAQLGPDASLVDLAIDGIQPTGQKSTVVDVRGEEPFVLREGAISSAAITAAVKS